MKKYLFSMYMAFVYINIIGYAFHFVVSRVLHPALYGEFMVLYAILLAGGSIAGSIGTSSVKIYVDHAKDAPSIHSYLRKITLFIGFFMFIVVIVLSPILNKYLNLSWPFFFVIIASGWLLMSLTSLEKGFLKAQNKFVLLSIVNSVELTLRLLFVIFALYIGLRVGGALLSSIFAIFFILVVLFFKNNNIKGDVTKIPIKKIIHLTLFTIPPGLFLYADDMFIRRFFSPQTAGYYAAVSILGKAFVGFLLTSLDVFFPKIVKKRYTNQLKVYLMNLFGLYGVFGVIAVILIILFGKDLFLILFGKHFESGFQYLLPYFISILFLAVHITFINIMLSFEKKISYIYITLFLYYVGFNMFHFTIFSYILYIGAFSLIVSVVDFVIFLNIKKGLKPSQYDLP